MTALAPADRRRLPAGEAGLRRRLASLRHDALRARVGDTHRALRPRTARDSRRHAVIERKEGDLTIEDLGSLNGTFLNRRRIDSGPLSDGDELQVGKYRLTFLQ